MKLKILGLLAGLLMIAVFIRLNSTLGSPRQPSFSDTAQAGDALKVTYPFDGTLFPKDIRSPEFRWSGLIPRGATWFIRVSFKGSDHAVLGTSYETSWTPSAEAWDDIRAHSLENPATFEVSASTGPAAAKAGVTFLTSKDPAGAPIFYRAVPAGPVFPTEKEFPRVKWNLGWISSYAPPINVMKEQRLCFNCHAASADGKTFGFDYNTRSEDMSSYLLFRGSGRSVTIRPQNMFDWNDYKRIGGRDPFQANASAISPDGKVVVTAGKALSLLAPKCPDIIQYSIFLRGILLYRTFDDPEIKALPGADDESFVHYPGSWSPDGKYIYFFGGPVPAAFADRIKAKLDGKDGDEHRKLGWRELDKLYPMRYGVYRIPFNGGKGGKAEPIRGASDNGRSNFFPRISPDGKWVVFAQSANGGTLIREDSDLYIVPAAGGEARKLKGSGPLADSWHSWSPNGRWLAFASKSYGPRTDIVLTHISAGGEDSPPVVLTQLRDNSGLSLNLPEFFNIKPGQFEEIIPELNAPAAEGDGPPPGQRSSVVHRR